MNQSLVVSIPIVESNKQNKTMQKGKVEKK
jgi:hypothetical protein